MVSEKLEAQAITLIWLARKWFLNASNELYIYSNQTKIRLLENATNHKTGDKSSCKPTECLSKK